MVLPENIIAIGGYAVTIAGVVYYVTRTRDHVRNELHIQEAHEAKIKERIADELEAVGAYAVAAARKILDGVITDPVTCGISEASEEPCPGSSRITELSSRLQLSRYMRIIDHILDKKIYIKVCGWIRENGFMDSNGEELEEYIRMRTKQALTSARSQTEDRICDLCPDLVGHTEERFPEELALAAMRRVVMFAKIEKKYAIEEIKKYRKQNGWNISRVVDILKG